jgi:F-type H+-transporting ATPase subunit alpha
LDRGARLVELLKQPQFSPYPIEEQVVSIYLGTKGHLDSVLVADVRRFESEFLEHLRGVPGILDEIRTTKDLSDDVEASLVDAIKDFKRQFSGSDGKPVINEHTEPLDPEQEGHESVKVHRPAPGQK